MNVTMNEDGTIQLSDFNELQSYKIARKLEKDGMDFYNTLLASSSEESVNSALKFLLESEKEHYDYFEKRIEELQAEKGDGFEEEDITDFVDTDIFTPQEIEQKKNIDFSNASSAILYGLIVEAKSIAFYTALQKNTTDDKGRSALEDIIEEEKKHLEHIREFA